MAAILKTDLYSKLERLKHWKLSLRCANANSILDDEKHRKNRYLGSVKHLTFQVSVITKPKAF